jgi:hypothetical protein
VRRPPLLFALAAALPACAGLTVNDDPDATRASRDAEYRSAFVTTVDTPLAIDKRLMALNDELVRAGTTSVEESDLWAFQIFVAETTGTSAYHEDRPIRTARGGTAAAGSLGFWVSYTPPAGFVGTDSFLYGVCPADLAYNVTPCAYGTVTVTVTTRSTTTSSTTSTTAAVIGVEPPPPTTTSTTTTDDSLPEEPEE